MTKHVIRMDSAGSVEDLPDVPADEFRYNDSPEDIAHDNFRRATFAAAAVKAYAAITTPSGGEEIQTVLGDLFNDLRHLCDCLGVDYDYFAERDVHYADEINGVL